METLFALFALGTWGFLGALTLFIIALVIFAEEDGVKATITLVLGALFLQFIAKYDLVVLLKERPFTLVSYAGLYVVLGVVWSVIKWSFYVKAQRRAYDRLRREFCKAHGITIEFTAELKKEWKRFLQESYRANKDKSSFRHYSSSDATTVIPDVTENKAAIIRWMTYWPFSVLFTLLNDPVRRLFEWIYENVGVWLQKIANKAFHGTERDFLTKEDEEDLHKQAELRQEEFGRKQGRR